MRGSSARSRRRNGWVWAGAVGAVVLATGGATAAYWWSTRAGDAIGAPDVVLINVADAARPAAASLPPGQPIVVPVAGPGARRPESSGNGWLDVALKGGGAAGSTGTLSNVDVVATPPLPDPAATPVDPPPAASPTSAGTTGPKLN